MVNKEQVLEEFEEVKPLELTDEVYDELIAQYKKVAVFEIDEDKYVFRYPRPIEYKALTSMISRETDTRKIEDLAKREVMALLVWPEKEVVEDRCSIDGALDSLLAQRFISYYFSRGNVSAQKKR